ncbi:hypothetical protein P280DRAFT_466284 [Massarina eburnea CBS 473.64]|uniref:RRM domain-containing protein n=1 Tax=Massarina eburnea CBS 473.64 TaxID=1395130 RepID=A0A6A6SDY0_9PLEO|nr:hypothetical protein P280DRAFT_466284 [Massarina eburnea CBS 473.64]
MPATPPAIQKQKAGATNTAPTTKGGTAQSPQDDENKVIRLHVTPFTPALLKAYLAPSVFPLAQNISYHAVETFPEKGFGYLELPTMEAQKLKKKFNGATLKGAKVRIEDAKPEKRKAVDEAEVVEEEGGEKPKKRSKKAKKEQGVLEGVELPDGRKVKRGWTEPPTKNKKEKKDKEKDKNDKKVRKESKYSKEPELLFKAKLTPVAATELALKGKKKDKKDKKEKKSRSRKEEVVVHEFAKKTNQPSFLKQSKVATEKKAAVDYINGTGWVDEDGNVVEAETGKVRNRRVLELVDSAPVQPTTEKQQSATPSSSESEDDESSVVSSSSEESSSDSEVENPAENPASPPAQAPKADTPEIAVTPSSPATKEVHPLEALFKRSKPSLSLGTCTPTKGLAPIDTSFSFFDNNDGMDVDAEAPGNPSTPYTQRDLEWRGLRSAAPTPDTAAVGRRFSFPWRKGSQDADDADADDDAETKKQLSNNTKANASNSILPDVVEEKEGSGEEDESEFKKWFWENQGSLNRAWKKRRRDGLKSKRSADNKKAVGGVRKAHQ